MSIECQSRVLSEGINTLPRMPLVHMIRVTKMLIKYHLTIKIILATLKYSRLACHGPNFLALLPDLSWNH